MSSANEPSPQDPNWFAVWQQLVEERSARRGVHRPPPEQDPWHNRAAAFQKTVENRWKNPDSSRECILAHVHPGATVLDIGAGSGAWSCLLAEHVRQVTAVEASAAMLCRLRSRAANAPEKNISIMEGRWPDVSPPPHDFSLCANVIYSIPDLEAFVRKTVAVTRATCFFIIRVIPPDSLLAEAAQLVFGHIHYRPHFGIFYNALQQMGIFANVLMEDTGLRFPWQSPSLENAVEKMKHQLCIDNDQQYDHLLLALAERSLKRQNGLYRWPPDIRSALVYWSA